MVNYTLSALHTHAPSDLRLTAAPDQIITVMLGIKISHVSLSRALFWGEYLIVIIY